MNHPGYLHFEQSSLTHSYIHSILGHIIIKQPGIEAITHSYI